MPDDRERSPYSLITFAKIPIAVMANCRWGAGGRASLSFNGAPGFGSPVPALGLLRTAS
jgi:hypothetical protein